MPILLDAKEQRAPRSAITRAKLASKLGVSHVSVILSNLATIVLAYMAWTFHDDAVNNIRVFTSTKSPSGDRTFFDTARTESKLKETDLSDIQHDLMDFVERCNSAIATSLSSDWGKCTFYMSPQLINRWVGGVASPIRELTVPALMAAKRQNAVDEYLFSANNYAEAVAKALSPSDLKASVKGIDHVAENISNRAGYEKTFVFNVRFAVQEIASNGGVLSTKEWRQTITVRLLTDAQYQEKLNLNEQAYPGGGTDFWKLINAKSEIIKYETVGN